MLDLVLPLNCAVCDKEGRYLCDEFEPALTSLEHSYCPKCAEPECDGLCERCIVLEPRISGILAPLLGRFSGVTHR